MHAPEKEMCHVFNGCAGIIHQGTQTPASASKWSGLDFALAAATWVMAGRYANVKTETITKVLIAAGSKICRSETRIHETPSDQETAANHFVHKSCRATLCFALEAPALGRSALLGLDPLSSYAVSVACCDMSLEKTMLQQNTQLQTF